MPRIPGERCCVWFLKRKRGKTGKVRTEPSSTMPAREGCASSEQRLPVTRVVRQRDLRKSRREEQAALSTVS